MARQDTKLEAEGAEFLVVGFLLVEGIQTYKSYTHFPGYDLIAVNIENKKIARIQVKSRWATGKKNFSLKNLDSDFLVFVALNREHDSKKQNLKPCEFYVIPTRDLEKIRRQDDWKQVSLSKIENLEFYKGNWSLIKDFLQNK